MQNNHSAKKGWGISVWDMTTFAMFAALMYISKMLMEALPNIHLLGMLTMVITLIYRKKALIPLYLYVFINGLFAGFSLWWVPYLYIWTVLWAATMLPPKNLPAKYAAFIYPAVCGAHGFLFGTLYAPAQALLFGFSFSQTIAWIIAGLPFDMVHGVGDILAGLLVLPLTYALRQLQNRCSTQNL